VICTLILVRGIVLPAYAAELLALYGGCLIKKQTTWIVGLYNVMLVILVLSDSGHYFL
jgi:hypothetical protein